MNPYNMAYMLFLSLTVPIWNDSLTKQYWLQYRFIDLVKNTLHPSHLIVYIFLRFYGCLLIFFFNIKIFRDNSHMLSIRLWRFFPTSSTMDLPI